MAGKIYTTYLSNMKNIPSNCMIRILVMRTPFKKLDMEKEGIVHMSELAPSHTLINSFKYGNINFDQFEIVFRGELTAERKNPKKALDLIEGFLMDGSDVCFVCCEKDENTCHRSILGKYYKEKGYEWKEVEK